MPVVSGSEGLQRYLRGRFHQAVLLAEARTFGRAAERAQLIEKYSRILRFASNSCGYCLVLSLLGRLSHGVRMDHDMKCCPSLPRAQSSEYFIFQHSIKYNPADHPSCCTKCHFPSLGQDAIHGAFDGDHPHIRFVLPMAWAIIQCDPTLRTEAEVFMRLKEGHHRWWTPHGIALWFADHLSAPSLTCGLALMDFLSQRFEL
ncbi:hypothetical protein EV121DRAFT_215404 [Schizophyllum commune]